MADSAILVNSMIDPLISLSFSMYSNPGVYALLLGSGVSRSAAIPSGWEIVRDLIRKLALLESETPNPTPEQWYRAKYAREPGYSDLLDRLTTSSVERSQILRSYFEPTDDERARGMKLPTKAHRAIAELMKNGFVRIVITTNFDRLLEAALVDLGVNPTVVNSPDAVLGLLPLVHTRNLILKVNGDYLDSRLKNTSDELTNYEPAMENLLDRIFDEFGLIVCGWSGEWDFALRNCIDRVRSRRFSTYWTTVGPLSAIAMALVERRSALVVNITGADAFYTNVSEKLNALSMMAQRHPLSAKIASSQTKKYIANRENRILLHDLVVDETEAAYAALDPQRFHTNHVNEWEAELEKRLRAYESICEVLLSIITVGSFWGDEDYHYLWQQMLRRIAEHAGTPSGMTAWVYFRLYPAVLLFYGASLAAFASRKTSCVANLLKTPITTWDKQTEIAADHLHLSSSFRDGLGAGLKNGRNKFTRPSEVVYDHLRSFLTPYLPIETDYSRVFDLFEYILAVFVARNSLFFPVGRFLWSKPELLRPDSPATRDPELAEIVSGLFSNGISDYLEAKSQYDTFIKQSPELRIMLPMSGVR